MSKKNLGDLFNHAIKAMFAIFFCGLFLFSCDVVEEGTPIGETRIMVVNTSEAAGNIDFFIDEQKINTQPVSYNNHTAYVVSKSGKKITETKQSANGRVLKSFPALFDFQKTYSYFICGKRTDSLIYLATEDNLTNPAEGRAKIRFINSTVSSPALNLVSAVNDSVLVSTTNFGTASVFNQIRPGTYNLRLSTQDSTVIFKPGITLTINTGKIYTIFTNGAVQDSINNTIGLRSIINN